MATTTTTTTATTATELESTFTFFEGVLPDREPAAAPAPIANPPPPIRVTLRRVRGRPVLVFRATPEADEVVGDVAAALALVALLAGARRKLFVIVDVSGSMSSWYGHLRNAMAAIVDAVQAANIPQGKAYIIMFATHVRTVIDAAAAGARDEVQVIEGGGTSYTAFIAAMEPLVNANELCDTVVFTDGDSQDDWRAAWATLRARFAPGSSVFPVYFGPIPDETVGGGRRRGAAAAFRGGAAETDADRPWARRSPYGKLLEFSPDREHFVDIDSLITRMQAVVVALANECVIELGDRGAAVRGAVFSSTEEVVAVVPLSPEQAEAHEALADGTAMAGVIRFEGVGADIAVTAVKHTEVQVLTPAEIHEVELMETATRVAEVRAVLERALAPDADNAALGALADEVEALVAFQREMKAAADDPLFVKLKEATAMAGAVLTAAAANGGSVAGIEVGGLRSAITQMGREARWSSTAAVGKRCKKAERTMARLSARMIKFQERVREIMATLKPLLAEHAAGLDEANAVAPEHEELLNDPVTLDPAAHPVFFFTTNTFTSDFLDDNAEANTNLMQAIDNPALGRAAFMCTLDFETYVGQQERCQALYGVAMVPLVAVPFRAAPGFVEVYAPVMLSNMVCGVNTILSRATTHAALGFAVPINGPAELPARMAFAPYWHAWVGRQTHAERPLLTWGAERCGQYTGLVRATAAGADHSVVTPQTAMMLPAFLAAVDPAAAPYPATPPPAVLLGTARLGVTRLVRDGKQAKIVGHVQAISAALHADAQLTLTPAEPDATPTAVLARLEHHLVAMLRPGGTLLTLQMLNRVVAAAAKLNIVMPTDALALSWDHPAVRHAATALWELARWRTPTTGPCPTVHPGSQSWIEVARTTAALHALFGAEHRDGTVARADANGGVLRQADVDRAAAAWAAVPDDVDGRALMATLFATPAEALTTALIVFGTEGHSGRLREVDPAEFAAVTPAVIERWAAVPEAVAAERAAAQDRFLRQMIAVAIERFEARDLRPAALFPLVRLALANKAVDLGARLMVVLSREPIVTARSELRAAFLAAAPATLMGRNDDITRAVQTVLRNAGEAAVKPDELLAGVPAALFESEAVVTALKDAGVPEAEIELRKRAPGATPCIPGSQRFNRKMRSYLDARAVAGAVDGDVLTVTDTSIGTIKGTVFDPAFLGAVKIEFVMINGVPLARRIELADNVVYTRDLGSADASARRWSRDWRKELNTLRSTQWLVKRERPVPDGAAAAGAAAADAEAAAADTEQPKEAVLDAIIAMLGEAPVFDE